jgi:hypothetical protein
MTANLRDIDLTSASALQTAADGKNYGIAIVANDKVIHWLLPFLESYLATNASTPLYLIPYDDNHAKTRKIAELYGVTFADIDCRELDALSKRLYPFSLGKRFRLRKLLSLALPLDAVIHLDCDIILFRDLSPFFELLEPGETDFMVITDTLDYVYNKKHLDYEYLRGAMLFNDGFFITSNKILSVQDFYDAMKADERVFHKVRQRGGLYAQPLTNFVTHRKGLKIKPIRKLVPGTSGESYHKAAGITFDETGPYDQAGKRIYFCHWPGVTGVPRGGAFDGAWQDFADRAARRVAAVNLDV